MNNNNCGQNCAACNLGSSTCTLCLPGSTLVKGQCVLCTIGCSVCSSFSITCLACSSAHYYDVTNGNCLPCALNCINCNDKGCTFCVTNYTLTSTFTCAAKCQYPCSACSTTDPTSCTLCVAGYTLQDTSCMMDLSCNSTGICTVCPFGYSLNYQGNSSSSTQTCVACAISSNCARCNPTSTWQCTSCLFGSWLTSNNVC